LDKPLRALAEITANVDCFHHSDKLIIGEEGNEVGHVQAEHPFISLDHHQGPLSDLGQLIN
jgi:hypothetical protein